MVRVVVIDRGALEHAQKLEPPVRAWKTGKGAGYIREAHAQLERHRGGRSRVLDIVPTGLPEVDPSQLMAGVVDRKGAAVKATVVGVLAEAVSDAPGRSLQRSSACVVRRQDRHPVCRQ